MMRVGELCAGYGGISLGLEMVLGEIELAFVADNDKGASKILAHRFPGVPNLGDISTVPWHDIAMAANRVLDDAQKLSAVQMYESGMSLAPIALYYGVSRQAMWDLLRRRTSLRPQVRYGSDNNFWRGGTTADDRAQRVAEQAIITGRLIRPELCEQCLTRGLEFRDGRAPIQAHHPDYNRPLDVMWLCQPCHHGWHAENTAVPLRGGDADGSLADIDILAAGFP
jgi:hypothetical protein